jgi:predicted  nucleic acid-binding Zn-ribbon protein
MAKMLAALLNLQSVERQLAAVKERLAGRKNAVISQQARLDKLKADWKTTHEKHLNRRKDSDRLSLELKAKEEQVIKLRSSLNSTKTNKEYAAILTQINTFKADNAKVEDAALKMILDAETIGSEANAIQQQIVSEQKRLEEIEGASAQEIARLAAMLEDLTAQRAEVASQVPRDALAFFDRIAPTFDGEAMAVIEVHGRKTPHEYICGGCYMSLNAEHANILRTRDELRTCDNCGRILYLQPQGEGSPAQ